MVDGYEMCMVAVVASGITLVGMGQYVAVPVIHPRRRRRHNNFHRVRLAYQPPSSSTFLSEQISHQQSARPFCFFGPSLKRISQMRPFWKDFKKWTLTSVPWTAALSLQSRRLGSRR
jgi:hypothetical protein